ncbi:MAG: ParB/RepB/Spo0J family partition protein [Akkermansiaceae bacterium]|nr:ParB/RepB/Spo0J family partition protein [Armatimonadota bacterium]
MDLQPIEVSRIIEDPEQPRKAIDDAALQGLADSIRQHGVLNPITVAPLTGVDGYRIITGERRWRASQIAGLFEIPCIVRPQAPTDTSDKATEQLIENLQREELAPLDKARAIKSLKEGIGATNKEVAGRLALSERTVGYLLDLMDLPEEIGEQIISSPNRPSAGNLTEKHGRFLRQLNDNPEAQAALVEKIKGDKLSSDETALYAKALRESPDDFDAILGEGPDGLRKRFGGGRSGDDISGGGRGAGGGGGSREREIDYHEGAYAGGPLANKGEGLPFSMSRAMVGIVERLPQVLAEINLAKVDNAADLDSIVDMLTATRARVDELLGEARRRI